MNVPFWVIELAADFWSEVGELESYPRELRPSVTSALPLTIALLPSPHAPTIKEQLIEHGMTGERHLRRGGEDPDASVLAIPLVGQLYPVPAPPLNLFPYLVLLFIIVMAAIAFAIGRSRPEVLRRAGTIMAAGESNDEAVEAEGPVNDPTERAMR